MACDSYCIREDYQARNATTTIEDHPGSYWTSDRLAISEVFQWEVYRAAYRYAAACSARVDMLDVGCGPAIKHAAFQDDRVQLTLVDQASVRQLATQHAPQATYYSIDLELAQERINRKFDVLICADVIEHLHDPDPCMKFLRDHAKGNSVLFISTPDRDRLYGPDMLTPGHPCHVREWSVSEFATFLRSRGMNIQSHRIVNQQRPSWLRRAIEPNLDRLGWRTPSFSCQLARCTIA